MLILTPAQNGSPSADLLTPGMLGLSPAQRGGKSFTKVYSGCIRLQEEFLCKCAEYNHMDWALLAVLAQIEERVHIFQALLLAMILTFWCRHLF